MKLSLRYPIGAALLGALVFPGVLPAQEDCVTSSNQHTRGADVEFGWANRRDDPQTKEERYTRALTKLEQSFAEHPEEPRAYLLGGQAYLGLRQWAAADSLLDRLVELAPQCEEQAHELRFASWAQQYNLGISRWQGGDPKAALEAFETANLILADARSLVNAASLHQGAGNLERAEALYRRALESGGEAEMVRTASINLGNLLRQTGRDGEALAIYEEYSSRNPEDVLGRLNYAVALLDGGRGEEAQAIFQELLVRDDLAFFQWYEVGVGLYRANDYERAAEAFRRAHELEPLNKEALENLTNALFQAGDFEALLPLAEQLLERYPYEVIHYAAVANAHRELGHQDAALGVLQRRDALPIEFLRAQLVADAEQENAFVVEGEAMNRTAPAQARVEVPFEFLGEGGGVVASEALVLELPEPGESSSFQLRVQAEERIAGFRYRQAAGVPGASGS